MLPPDDSSAEVDEFAPSAKLVYKVLEREGTLTQKRLVDRTHLARSTVGASVTHLEQVELVEERFYAGEAGQRLYALADDR